MKAEDMSGTRTVIGAVEDTGWTTRELKFGISLDVPLAYKGLENVFW